MLIYRDSFLNVALRAGVSLGLLITGCTGATCPTGLVSMGGHCVEDSMDAAMGDAGETGGTVMTGGMMVSGGNSIGTGGMDKKPAMNTTGGADAAMDATTDLCDAIACGDHATCVVDMMTAACECEEGYVDNGAGCERDECIPLPGDPATCGDHSQCDDPSAAEGDVVCICDEGYIDNGAGCERDECIPLSGDPATCGVNAICDDPSADVGDVICSCEDGYADCGGPTQKTPGCAIDLLNDANHCGKCGYSCAGNLACVQGKCELAADRLVLGTVNTCALSNGSGGVFDLECAGDNTYNQLRIAPASRSTMGTIAGFAKVRDVSMSAYHACVIPSDGSEVSCWGINAYNELGSSDTSLDSSQIVHVKISNVTFAEVSAGAIHTCARTDGGDVYCWGAYHGHRLGVAQPNGVASTEVPQKVPGVSNVVQLSGSGSSTCALSGTNGTVRCWGAVSSNSDFAPKVIKNDQGSAIVADKIVVGGLIPVATYDYASYCALLKDGEVVCWGAAALGLVGGMTSVAESADTVTNIGISDAMDVSLGSTAGCAVLKTGVLQCWGAEQFQDPRVGGIAFLAPTAIPMPDKVDDVIDVEVGGLHACVRRGSGQVLCMGNNQAGQFADGMLAADNTPQPWSAMMGYP